MSGAPAGFRQELSGAPNESRPAFRTRRLSDLRGVGRGQNRSTARDRPLFVEGGDGAASPARLAVGLCRPPHALG